MSVVSQKQTCGECWDKVNPDDGFYGEIQRLGRARQLTDEKVQALREEFKRQFDALPKYTPMAVGMKPKVVTNAGEIVSDLSVRLNPGDPNWRGEERLVVLKPGNEQNVGGVK
jgi:hypothetical protein